MKRIKAIIAVFCAISCLLVSTLVPSVNTVKAADYPNTLKEIYPCDFGIEDGTYSKYNADFHTYNGDSLLNTVFTMDIKFAGGDMYFNYAGTAQWVGLLFSVSENNIHLKNNGNYAVLESEYDFNSNVAGTKFKDVTFRFSISLEACDNDGGGTENDIKIGVYFNHVLYNNTYIYAHNATEKIGNILYFLPHTQFVSYEIASPIKQNSDNAYTVSPADFGVFDGRANGEEKDINVGLDGKLFTTNVGFKNNGDYIDYSGIKLESDGFGGITISDSTGNNSFESEKIYTDISDLNVITYSDFGMNSGVETVGSYGKYEAASTLGNTYFTGKFKFFPNGNLPQILYGGRNNSWGGIRIKYSHNAITVDNTKTYAVDYTIYPQDVSVGLGSFADADKSGWSVGMDIGVSLRYGDYDGDGLSDDVEYGIFIMGKLADNKYTYIYDFADTEDNNEASKMGVDLRLYCPGNTVTNEETGEETLFKSGVELSAPISHPALDTENFDLEIFTKAIDADTDNQKDDLEAKIFIDNTLIKTLAITDYTTRLTGKLKVNADIKNPQKQPSYKDAVTNIADVVKTGYAAINNSKTNILSANTEFSSGSKLSLAIASAKVFSFTDFGIADGSYKSGKVASGSLSSSVDGALFSGKVTMAANTVFYYGGTAVSKGIAFSLSGARLKIADMNGTQIALVTASSTNGAVTAFKDTEFTIGLLTAVTDTDNDGQQDDVKLTVWFNDTFYNTYNIANSASKYGNFVTATSTNTNYSVAVKTHYSALSADGIEAKSEKLWGIDLTDSADGIKISSQTHIATISKNGLGLDFAVSVASLDDDRVKNDIVVNLYVDGVCLNNASYFIKDLYKQGVRIELSAEGVVFSDRLPEDSLPEKLYNLNLGDYALLGVGDITVNREAGHSVGEMLTTPGEYTIIRTYLGKEYTERVSLFKVGYINSDKNLNILDFISVNKYAAGETKATHVRKGGDLDFDGKITARDIVKIKRIILGVEEIPTEKLIDQWSFKEDEMPIIGFYSPKTTYLHDGSQDLTANLCTDEVYKLISDLGINFLNYIESQYNELAYGIALLENKNCTLKNLELASKYGMGSVVWLTSGYGEANYLKTISRFSHYSAFAGLNIIDEPYSLTYYDRNVGPVDEMTGAGERYKALTGYANLYGYANLFPYVLSMTQKKTNAEGYEVYREYMREFCQKFNPKVLSWDHYVLNSKSYKNYFKNLEIGRDVAKEFDIPFWIFMQTGDTLSRKGDNATKTTTEEMLWNLNTALAYGTKGIQYYTLVQTYGAAYDSNTDSYDLEQSGLISVSGEKTRYYDQALAVNNQVKAVDHVLVNSDSEAILAIGGAQSETGITKTAYGCLTSATATAQRGAVIGCFNYRGKQAFYVASNSFEEAQTVTLTFDGTHTLNLISYGLDSTVSANEYQLSLGKGEAVLIVVD